MYKLLTEIKNKEGKRELGDIDGLKDSIKSVGLINPITINENGDLLAGYRRLEAVRQLGRVDIEVKVLPIKGNQLTALKVALDENLKRKNLTDPEVAVLIKEYDELRRKFYEGFLFNLDNNSIQNLPTIEGDRYTKVKLPQHPRSDKRGYVNRSIVIWECANKRLVRDNETIHHIDGDTHKDIPQNLVCLDSGYHLGLAQRKNSIPVEVLREVEASTKVGRPKEIWTQAQTAKDLGITQGEVARSIKIATAIEEYPELAGKSGQEILTEYKRQQSGAIRIPQGTYHTIVIDPPWPAEKIKRDCSPNQFDYDYATMTIEEIKALTFGVCEDGCHIYLWATQKYLPVAFEILKHWGFNYIFTMVWHKSGGFQPFNLPQYNCEFVLFGKRGNLDFLTTKGFFTCFNGGRREHSRKPDEFYDLVRRVSPEPRIDIFSREKRDGFEQYGNETGKF